MDALEHLELSLPSRRWEGAIELLEIFLGEVNVERGTVFASVGGLSGAGNRYDVFGPKYPGQSNLSWCSSMPIGDRAYRCVAEQPALLDR